MKKWVAVFVMLLCLTLTMVALGDDDGFEIDGTTLVINASGNIATTSDLIPVIAFAEDTVEWTIYQSDRANYQYTEVDDPTHELYDLMNGNAIWDRIASNTTLSYISINYTYGNYADFEISSAIPVGDYTLHVSCTWENQTIFQTIIVHVLPSPNGALKGLTGMEKSYTMKVGDTLDIVTGTLPANWSLPNEELYYQFFLGVSGGDYGLTTDFDPYFEKSASTQNELHIKALKAGYYRIECDAYCANFYADATATITVLNQDGTAPEKNYREIKMNSSRINTKVGETYYLSFTQLSGEPMTWDNLDFSAPWNYFESTDISTYATPTDLIAGPYMECVTTEPGYYTLEISYYDDYLGYPVHRVLVCVTDEKGNLPEPDEIEIYANFPKTAVVGETFHALFTWWGTVSPSAYHVDCYFNGEMIDSFVRGDDHSFTFAQAGTYRIVLSLTDAIGRTAGKEVLLTVTEPSPLKNASFKVLKIKENGEEDHDVFTEVSFEGGMAAVTAHYIIYAKNRSNEWYRTWEEDNVDFSRHFWIGEDGEHKIEVILSDGVSEISATTEIFTVGEAPDYVFESSFKLPSGLKEIEAEAFAGDTSITSVVCPTGLITIGKDAFKGCSGLKAIYIPETVETIEGNPFTSSQLVVYGRNTTCEAYRFAVQYGYQFIKTYGMQ